MAVAAAYAGATPVQRESAAAEMHADVAQIRADAAAVRGLADDARSVAAALRDALGVDFVSKAADRYRADLREAAARADATARELDDAAAALLAHARRVEERLRQLEALEQWFRQELKEARGVLASIVDVVQDAASSLLQERASRLIAAAPGAPPSGSPAWEAFTRAFKR